MDHILVRHAEMAPFLSAVEATLVAPDRLMSDTSRPDRRNFYRRDALSAPFEHLLLKVCVEFGETGVGGPDRGRIITAYATPTVKRGEVQLWP